MLLKDFRDHFRKELKGEFPATEIDSFFYILISEYLGIDRLQLAINPETKIESEKLIKLESALKRLKSHEPIQYITGKQEFFGMEFRVDKNVLVPRPETEELVQWILDDIPNKENDLKILDIGTGSGCIAISLAAYLKNAGVQAYDISEMALEIASQNAEINKAEVQLKRQDILKLEKLDESFDIIVSNPPYVRELEKKEMNRNVLEHEPDTALYVEDQDALVFYRKIAGLAQISLPVNGLLYFEINQYLAHETEALVKKMGFETELKKDIFGNFRMLKGIKI
ncbi:peptide chain release factor N(5)-glutamine methyltransferase [Gramella sp. GC03-9]|uniref:Release factor glutamine methyltransferase n=1 Tax=Christiangramia oceanisediminis TaxID=2920386 RepID=A0A9X2I4K1_9FLAO|nr:peptide chain release factor N(5)-glutamine methyltransferase [Gramella oceanisediminis]MCP9199735.1 peptide chain release factor N(5)-glutamine methyltransferase [Gramella oceanisediminis]